MTARAIVAARRARREGAWVRAVFVACIACAGVAVAADTADDTASTLTLVVAAVPGGGVDRLTRLYAGPLAAALGRNVVVENRAGAGTQIASETVAQWSRAGDALLVTTPASLVDLSFNPDARPNFVNDFVPIAELGRSGYLVVVGAASPARDFAGLLALARKRPGALAYGTVNVQSTQRLIGELLRQRTGIDVVQVPYKGEPAIMLALQSGELDFAIVTEPSAQGSIDAGKLRALASVGATRSRLNPGVPTLVEAGLPDVQFTQWTGLLARAGTPPEVLARYVDAMRRAAEAPGLREQARTAGVELAPGTPAAFKRHIDDDYARFRAIIVAGKIPTQ